MALSTHRIRSLRLRVVGENTFDAFDLRRQLRKNWREILVSCFEEECHALCHNDEVIHFPKISINLNISAGGNVLEQLPDLLRREFRLQLQTEASEQSLPTENILSRYSISQKESSVSTLQQYLQTGTLPWSASYLSSRDTRSELHHIAHTALKDTIHTLLPQSSSSAFFFRLFQLLPSQEWEEGIQSLSTQLPSSWQLPVKDLFKRLLASEDTTIGQSVLLTFTAIYFDDLFKKERHQSPSDIEATVQKLYKRLPYHQILPLAKILSSLNSFPSEDTHGQAQSATSQQASQNLGYPINKPPIEEKDPLQRQATEPEQEEPLVRFGVPKDFQRVFPDPVEILPTEKPAFFEDSRTQEKPTPLLKTEPFPLIVNYAGLILLHPFLGTLFETTGFKTTSSKSFSPDDFPRAAALLHFLATGGEDIFEFDLGFIKILLGMESTQPLLVSSDFLSLSDQDEARTLLVSVITHWSALKNVSIHGLQTSFLQRKGIVRKAEQGWTLHIESTAYDILLHRLPWSISVVRLPWMKQAVFTEWEIA